MRDWVTELTMGDLVWNDDDTALELTGVSVIEPDGLSLIDAVVLPVVDPGALIGSAASFPPVERDGESPAAHEQAWAAREPAVGAVIPPDETQQLVIGLRVNGDGSDDFPAIAGVRVEYVDPDGREHALRTPYRVGVGCTADDWDFPDGEPEH